MEVLKVAYGSTSATRLRALTLRFNQYVLDPKNSMIQHLDVMKDMIRELQNAGCELSDEQQVLAVFRSLPEQTWGYVKLVLTHNEQIKTFDSVASHLKLEADRRESERAQQAAFVAHAGQRKPHKGKRWNKSNGAGPSQSQKQNLAPQGDKTMKHRRGKRGGKKNMEMAKCYNCQKMDHFARECTEPKKIRPNPSSPNYFVCSHVFLANSLLGWIVDTGATKHVTRDRAGFVDYHRVPACSHYIAMGNGAQEEVLGIGSYQLKLSTGRELFLSDVQYAPNIRCNLLSVTALMEHGQERMTRLAREGLLGSLAKVNLPTCEPCMAGKACRKPFGKAKRATHPLELVHSDICGPMNVRARHGAFYFLTFIDDYSRYGFPRGGFPSISEVKGNLELYELRDPQGGASITVEGETPRSYPVIDEDNESDPKLSGSCSLEEHNSQNPQMRRSKRGGISRRRYEIEGESFMCASVDIDEPATYEEAVTSPNANEWITAMKEEMSSMAKNNVWELVDLPAGRKTIGNKWVLKVKRKADGSIDKFKARLVAKGYTQREGIDYEETFSPVVRFASVRLILAIVAHLDLELFQMDVKTAFLNGELDEEIYMDQPEGFQEMGQKRKVCHLKRSIYGLKQSSRQWYYRFHRAITSIGFTMVEEDHCVYVKRSEKNFMILSLYVDDILLAGNNMEMIVALRSGCPQLLR
ncbi:UNVERIFIED_CONTAM: Retrovirus-related Pol polyprotein from transposon TNT 1-94 [Sesamum latifolium]|uniref:Retrovirus-related Pol polyprotein from transposon TNT 1-94 n=1 Tax=Sesamum latifolium TaxID=2727402 RepID=A0AAW2UX55_9LAMI